jgi:hypothetical protein
MKDITDKPDVSAEWLTILLRFQEVPGSNLGSEPVILTEVRFFVIFLSPSRQIPGQYKKLKMRGSFHIFSNL